MCLDSATLGSVTETVCVTHVHTHTLRRCVTRPTHIHTHTYPTTVGNELDGRRDRQTQLIILKQIAREISVFYSVSHTLLFL